MPVDPLLPLRRVISAEVTALLGEYRGAAAGDHAGDSFLGPRSVVRRVHSDLPAMLASGVSALLLQMLHPAVLAGVWDHSGFRADMTGRLRRTARFVAVTTYGSRSQAEEAIAQVRSIHRRIRGVLPDGTPYAADDPELLDWVHLSGAWSFLAGWRRYGDRGMSGADQDRYFAEMAEVALALGATRPPRNRREAERVMREARPRLRVDERTREIAGLILNQHQPDRSRQLAAKLVGAAGVDLLPCWATHMHGLEQGPLKKLVLRSSLRGVASVMRGAT